MLVAAVAVPPLETLVIAAVVLIDPVDPVADPVVPESN